MTTTKPQILLLDDDRTFLRKVSRYLGFSGLRAKSYHDPLKALAAWKEGGFQVAVTDINMPEMNGLEVVRKLRSQDGGARVVVLTGQDDEKVRHQAMSAGAAIFLTKPLDLERFVAVLADLLDGQSANNGPDSGPASAVKANDGKGGMPM